MLTKMTTKKHFNKYQTMAREAHIKLTADSLRMFGLNDLPDLQARFEHDPWLNNIPLQYFDCLFHALRAYQPHLMKKEGSGPHSYAECTCLYKHLLVYELLKVQPIFEER